MKKILLTLLFFISLLFFKVELIEAQAPVIYPPPETPVVLCGCPTELNAIYQEKGPDPVDGVIDECVSNGDPVAALNEFNSDPRHKHLWIEDSKITAQGKANERARQFIFWVMTHGAIDNHPAVFRVWQTTRNVAYFLTILTAAILGLAIIVGQKTNFATGIKVWPSVIKILLALVYISFSATVVVTMIQLSEILMKFFIENLGGKDLFNIYFSAISDEKSYVDFVGCRDLNIRVQEGIYGELWVLKLTNFSYYVMSGMILLRKILLWFLVFVSPFLAILFSFGISKNVGWIWIGVFFQWLFYGPLFALFLGGLAQIWKAGIPFLFDFSRTDTMAGYIYPTATNILYGGPAQRLGALNNGNYVDTFAEYIITLLMLWAVTWFPWWLLRTFRDYCCEGIMAIKNILVSNLNQFRPGFYTPPPTPPSKSTPYGEALEIKRETTIPIQVKTRIETIEEIKKANTEEIVRSLDMRASRITDIAHLETNRNINENVTKNINYLKNPTQASTSTERVKYMNLRTELSSRAVKADTIAKQVLNSVISSKTQQVVQRQTIIKSLPKAVPVTNVISVKVNVPEEKVQMISSSVVNYGAKNSKIVSDISNTTNVPKEKIQNILNVFNKNVNRPVSQTAQKISEETNIDETKVNQVISTFLKTMSSVVNYGASDPNIVTNISSITNVPREQVKNVLMILHDNIDQPMPQVTEKIIKETNVNKEKIAQIISELSKTSSSETTKLTEKIAKEHNLKADQVKKILTSQVPLMTEPGKSIKETVPLPPTVSIDEYEQVKTMWKKHYEKGEIPVTENIKSRTEWVEKDVVIITNTLNKLLSDDKELRDQALDEIGFILPIFLVNNLSGEQLVAYLKAKLEAAKEVNELQQKEEEISEKLKAESEEEKVEVARPKEKEAEKTMEMVEGLEMEDKSKEEKKEEPKV